MIFYFSGAGDSYWIARELGRMVEEPVRPITEFLHQSDVCVDEGVVGIVCPTHVDDVPWVVKQFALNLDIVHPHPYVFCVMAYSSHNTSDGFINLDHGLRAHGACLSFAQRVRMPGICKPTTPEEDRMRLEEAPTQVQAIARSVRAREVNFVSDGESAEDEYVQSSWLYKPDALLKRFAVSDECTGCNTCTMVCPMDNIFVYSGKALHGDACAACYACVHWCPQGAVSVKMPLLRGMRRYHHPGVTLHEMRQQNVAKRSIDYH